MSQGGARFGAETGSPTPPRSRIGLAIAGAIAVAVISVLVGFALGRVGGDDVATVDQTTTTDSDGAGPSTTADDDSTTTVPDTEREVDDTPLDGPAIAPPTTISVDGLEGDALGLAEAINRASGLEYHARYSGEATAEGETTTVDVEIWRRLPRARRDTTISGGRQLSTSEFRLLDGVYGCIGALPEVELTCYAAPTGTVDPSDPTLGAVDPRGGLVVARDGEFNGARVSCWEVESLDAATTTLCVDVDGIPVVIDAGDGRLLRTALDDDIDATTFALPADVEDS